MYGYPLRLICWAETTEEELCRGPTSRWGLRYRTGSASSRAASRDNVIFIDCCHICVTGESSLCQSDVTFLCPLSQPRPPHPHNQGSW